MRDFVSLKDYESKSFINIFKAESFNPDLLNYEAIFQFLTFGAYYFQDTPIKSVEKKFTHQELLLDKSRGFKKEEISDKNPLEEEAIRNPVDSFISFFEERAGYLQNQKISVDLTGGIDSRLIATILKYFKVPFEAVFSLDSGTEEEAEIVKEVANALGVNVHFLKSEEIQREIELQELFEMGDGLYDVLALKSLKNTQQWRSRNGFKYVITGIGGELYKDFWWQQDFPFYQKGRANLKRLVNNRMYPLILKDEWLGDDLKKNKGKYRKIFFDTLQMYNAEYNTQVYDQIYYHVRIKEQVSALTNAASQYVNVYSPLLETELLKIGYNLKRSNRFFNHFHREVITRLNSEVARIPTTEGGMSVSNDIELVGRDLFLYGKDKLNKAKQKIFKASAKQKNVSEKSFSEFVQQKVVIYLQELKKAGILSNEAPKSAEKVPKKLWGRIITLGMLLESKKN